MTAQLRAQGDDNSCGKEPHFYPLSSLPAEQSQAGARRNCHTGGYKADFYMFLGISVYYCKKGKTLVNSRCLKVKWSQMHYLITALCHTALLCEPTSYGLSGSRNV